MTRFTQPIVFVLGSGFTKAFDDDAPMLDCDIGLKKLQLKYIETKFPRIHRFLNSIKIKDEKNVNVEDLMSRLYAGMPFDGAVFSVGEREILHHDILTSFTERLNAIRTLTDLVPENAQTLRSFAKFITNTGSSIITFNYDTLCDQALLYDCLPVSADLKEVKTSDSVFESAGPNRWHPDGGYGFFCRNAIACIDDGRSTYKDHPQTLLLKLHGSLNWRIKKGFRNPCPIDSLVHEQEWYRPSRKHLVDLNDIKDHLDERSFIVPPILDKNLLNDQPVLKLVWEKAFEKLANAKTVVFIGYSMPKTDIAARNLFRESLKRSSEQPHIIIVNKWVDAKQEEDVRETYRDILDWVRPKSFCFDGAVNWVKAELIR